jgi:hypothetical protein
MYGAAHIVIVSGRCVGHVGGFGGDPLATTKSREKAAGSGPGHLGAAACCNGRAQPSYQSVDSAVGMARFTEAMRAIASVPKAEVVRVEAREKAAPKAKGERAK